jgi:phage tail sheath protein FI
LYHPWLISRDTGKGNLFRTVPPDGAICGMMAQRALSRGAWVAPANETLQDVVALAPPVANDHRLPLLESRINLISQEPNGFIVLSADTLSEEKELRPINVRRLLILIRKLALKKGAEYVFEPNDVAFRRMVQRGFESMLDELFMRGAFSGATPAMAYQVVTDSSANSPHSVDQGRFIVELKVSPSRPMTFLTVRLMQTGDRMSIVEGA